MLNLENLRTSEKIRCHLERFNASLRGAEGAKFRVSYTMMRLIEQDVVMQRLALESDDDKEQHFLDYEVRSLKPRECRFLSFGLFDI